MSENQNPPSKSVKIYTDGACRGNPGPGGWGVLMRYNGVEKTLSGSEEHTTNNQMELMAAIRGLNALKKTAVLNYIRIQNICKKG